jgi:hypothetical protein
LKYTLPVSTLTIIRLLREVVNKTISVKDMHVLLIITRIMRMILKKSLNL